MRILSKIGVSVLLGVFAVGMSACDWTSGGGGTDFNSSQGVNVNWSGVYKGILGGGRAVSQTSRGNITRLVISQGGNRIEVLDNQGSTYVGSVGAPGAISTPDATGSFPAGALLVQSQVTWRGKDGVAAKDIEFVGVLHIVAVSEIRGESSSVDRTTTRNLTDSTTIDSTSGNSQVVILPGGQPFVETDTINQNRTITETDNRTGSSSRTSVFNLTEQNSQFRLQGTWVEEGGVVAEFDALSAGGIASLITTAADDGGGATGN